MRDVRLRARVLYLLRAGHDIAEIVRRTGVSRSTVYRVRAQVAPELHRRERMREAAEAAGETEAEMERLRDECRRLGQELRDLRKRDAWQRRALALAWVLGELLPYSVAVALRREGSLTLRVVGGGGRTLDPSEREFVVVDPGAVDDPRIRDAVAEAWSAYEETEVLDDDGHGDVLDRIARRWRGDVYGGAGGGDVA